ncbi:E1-E2 ATPase-domain-containing protein [Chiua virens]|nr:E1-E2 ATPase-domain-containing protein [Chiua virens]
MSTSRRSLHVSGKRASPIHMTASAHTDAIEFSVIPEPSTSSTSAHSVLHSMSTLAHPPQDHNRPPSPPASSYFSSFDDTQFAEPQPTPGATSHFAYSTTLRRHHAASMDIKLSGISQGVTAEGFFQKAWDAVAGRRSRDDVLELGGYPSVSRRPSPSRNREEKRDTPSARFAHCSVEETVVYFQSSEKDGLSTAVIPSLQNVHGYNEFSVSTPEPVLLKFAKTIYESPLILLLCGSAVISAIMGNIDDAISITVAVTIVLTVGFIQEQRSEKSLEALNKLVPHHCHVIRDQRKVHILANELVPGDIVSLSTGDRVPADIRVMTSVDLEIDESSLTGETIARQKDNHTRGTCRTIVYRAHGYIGHGTGIVIAIGAQTEFGVIFSMMQDVDEKRTPLQLSMDELAKKLSFLSFGVIGVICLIGMLQQRPWLDMFTIGVSLAVAAIPEGLPIVTTVTLALGVMRMSKRKAIVKKLHSVESLGSVSVIWTLTKNEQTVVEIYVVDENLHVDAHQSTVSPSPAVRKTLEIGSLCNNAVSSQTEEGVYIGQSTDVALINVLPMFGLYDQRNAFTRLSEQSFNSERKYMAISGVHTYSSALYNGTPREIYYIKGAIEGVIDRCKHYYVSDSSTPSLDSRTRSVILSNAQAAASKGLRVLAMAYGYGSVDSPKPDITSSDKSRNASPAPDAEKNNLIFAGFQAMLDPPRKGVADAIGLLQSGGVQVVMIHRRCGTDCACDRTETWSSGSSNQYCMTGKEIDQMSKAQLVERVGSVSVFARTTPRHKMAIVEAFQARGAVVAMTGDGVNDAPALKMADIGVSMGKSGTDVAKEAADMILVDDNFSTILPAVEEGKSIFHNIQNFLCFQLSTAAAALSLITLSTLLGY